jgi:putative SOS response-associated peptidase YedK
MCGRFGLWAEPQQVQDHFQLQEPLSLEPRYNIAPSQEILSVGQDETGRRHAAALRWGLIPHWSKDRRSGYKMINARAESLWKKSAYKSAAKRRRCIVPASCFFEWRRSDGTKQPYCLRPKGADLFAFAAIWERWSDPETEEAIFSCAIVTTPANEAVAELHDRMPAILDPSGFDLWLDRGVQESSALRELLQPCPSGWLELYPVSKRVNSPKNDSKEVVRPIEA